MRRATSGSRRAAGRSSSTSSGRSATTSRSGSCARWRTAADRRIGIPKGFARPTTRLGPAPSGFRGLPPRTRGAGERGSPSADTRPPWRPSSGARHRQGSRPAPLRGVVDPEVDLLQGRIARRGAWQRRGPHAQMLEDLAPHRGLGDRRDHAHLPAASRTHSARAGALRRRRRAQQSGQHFPIAMAPGYSGPLISGRQIHLRIALIALFRSNPLG